MALPNIVTSRGKPLARWLLAFALVGAMTGGLFAGTQARADESVSDVRTHIEQNIDETYVTPDPENAQNNTGFLDRLRSIVTNVDESSSLVETGRTIDLKLTFVDEDMVSDGMSIDDFFANPSVAQQAFVYQAEGVAPILDAGEENDYYVAFLDSTILNGVDGHVIAADFAENNVEGMAIDSVVYDAETGVAYIPKDHFRSEDGEELARPMQAQLLVAFNVETDAEVNIPVTTNSNIAGVKTAAHEQMVTHTGYDNVLDIPVVAEKSAGKVDLDDLVVYLDGSDLPLDTNDTNSFYDQETGVLSILMDAQACPGLRIEIGEGNEIANAAARIVMPTKAHAATKINKRSEMGFYDKGALTLTSDLKKGFEFTYKSRVFDHNEDSESYINYLIDASNQLRNSVYGAGNEGWSVTSDHSAAQLMSMSLDDMLDANTGDGSHLYSVAMNASDYRMHVPQFITLPPSKWADSDSMTDDVKLMFSSVKSYTDDKTYVVPSSCMHIDTASGDHHATDNIYGRVLDVEKDGDNPYAIIQFVSLHVMSNHQQSQCVIKFRVKAPTGYLELKKSSAVSAITDGNGCYSLNNAQYGVYSDSGCTKKVADLQTAADGMTNTVELDEGTYYIKETKAPQGYVLDSETYEVKVKSGETTTFKANDLPSHDPGELKLLKVDAETGEAVPQGDASLAGAEFTVKHYGNTSGSTSGEPLRTWVFKTDANGTIDMSDSSYKTGGDDLYVLSGEVVFPLGTYTVQETKAPAGYKLSDTATHVCTVTPTGSDGQGVWKNGSWNNQNVPAEYEGRGVDESPIKGGVRVGKVSAETGDYDPQGDSTLAGAEFTITNKSAKAVKYGDGMVEPGEVVTTITTVEKDGKFIAETGTNDLSYGTYEVRETKVPEGYLLNEDWSATVEVREDGKVYEYTAPLDQATEDNGEACPNQIIRNDFSFTKKSEETADRMGNIAFRMTSETTGESHIIVTDANGYFDSAKLTNSKDTNANDAAVTGDVVDDSKLDNKAGVWFSGMADKTTEADDKASAFPYDTYRIEELRCKGNEGMSLILVHVDLKYDNSFRLDWGTIDDRVGPEIMTEATGETGTHTAQMAETVTIIDTVSYYNLKPGKTYTMTGTLMDKETGEPLLDADGNEVKSDPVDFTPKAANGTVEITFTFKAPEDLAGKRVVAFEDCTQDGKQVATHADIEDEDQTVGIVKIGTTLQGTEGEKVMPASSTLGLVDVVAYEGLTPGATYIMTGTLVDGTSGKKLPVEAVSVSFVPEEANGTVEVPFEIDASDLPSGTIVCFETLTDTNKTEIAKHEDLDDEGQTVRVPSIGTTAKDEGTQTRIAPVTETVTIVDTVAYHGLEAGKTYNMTGTLMNKATEEPLADADGNTYESNYEFTPETEDGEVEITFEVPGTVVAGKNVVVFENCYEDETLVALHADINDEKQTVGYPTIKTTATDKGTGEHYAPAVGKRTVTDVVTYEGLKPGHEYTISGVLHYKDAEGKDAGELLDTGGNAIVATKTFTPETADGAVVLEFTVEGEVLAGKRVVAFETAYFKDLEIAVHADIDDEDQTVEYPKIGTTLTNEAGSHVVKAEKVTLIDTVTYENLLVGQKYTMTGTLMDKETGEALTDAKGNPITATQSFVADKANGTVKMTFVVDLSSMDGKAVVAFESCALDATGKAVAEHKDLSDMGQTVTVNTPHIATTLINKKTGDHTLDRKGTATVIDTVKYEGLTPGTEYVMTGEIHVNKNGKDAGVLKSGGKKVTATTTFTPSKSSGTVKLTFKFNVKDLGENAAVAFETCTYKSNGKVVATHKDINDADQTVTLRKTSKTTTVTKTTSGGSSTGTSDTTRTLPQTGNGPLAAILAAVGVAVAVAGYVWYRKSHDEDEYTDVIGGSH